jgi:hypothetical protein
MLEPGLKEPVQTLPCLCITGVIRECQYGPGQARDLNRIERGEDPLRSLAATARMGGYKRIASLEWSKIAPLSNIEMSPSVNHGTWPKGWCTSVSKLVGDVVRNITRQAQFRIRGWILKSIAGATFEGLPTITILKLQTETPPEFCSAATYAATLGTITSPLESLTSNCRHGPSPRRPLMLRAP